MKSHTRNIETEKHRKDMLRVLLSSNGQKFRISCREPSRALCYEFVKFLCLTGSHWKDLISISRVFTSALCIIGDKNYEHRYMWLSCLSNTNFHIYIPRSKVYKMFFTSHDIALVKHIFWYAKWESIAQNLVQRIGLSLFLWVISALMKHTRFLVNERAR